MCGTFVRRCLSTGMYPRSLTFTPALSSPRLLLFGRRPTDTRTRSNVSCGGTSFPSSVATTPLVGRLQRRDLRVQVDRLELLPQAVLERLDQVAVGRRQQAVGELDDHDLRPQGGVDGADLQTDVPAADHEHSLRDVGQQQGPGRVHDPRVAEGERLRHRRHAAGGDDRVLELDRPGRRPVQLDGVRVHERGPRPGDDLDPAALAQAGRCRRSACRPPSAGRTPASSPGRTSAGRTTRPTPRPPWPPRSAWRGEAGPWTGCTRDWCRRRRAWGLRRPGSA